MKLMQSAFWSKLRNWIIRVDLNDYIAGEKYDLVLYFFLNIVATSATRKLVLKFA